MSMFSTIYNVKFPGLNLNFRVAPVAFRLGSVPVYWYGIIICIAFVLALCYVLANCNRFGINQNAMVDAVIVGLVCGIIGARLYYVIFFPGDVYLRDPIKILHINEGGIAIYGGLIGGILGGLIVAKKKKINIMAALDLASLGFLIGQSVGRWGNFVNQEAFGQETASIFGMISENTGGVAVHPCFLYESVWCLAGFLILHFFSIDRKKYDGQIFLLYIVWYGSARFIIEALRTDSLFVPGINLKISQIVALVSVAVGAYFLFRLRNRRSRGRLLKINLPKG